MAAFSALWLPRHLAIGLSANAFFLVYLVLTGIRIPRLTATYLRANAPAEDEPASVLFAVTLAAVAIAVASLFVLVNAQPKPGAADLFVALSSVALGWLTIHTMASIHYAHLYWRPTGAERKKSAGGLAFPGEGAPNGYDFLYFGFIIGMTAQTSDTGVTSTQMRKATLLHSLVSYLFNTVLVAAAVNVVVSLGGSH
nr:DUF1345 domain-containing protein [Pseudaminobacter soli]